MKGSLLLISSDSKLGKTVLVTKYTENSIFITSMDLNEKPLYETIAENIGLKIPIETERTKDIKVIGSTKTSKIHVSLKNEVLNAIGDMVIVIDNIHFCSDEVISYLAKELKFLITKVMVVVTSHPNEVNKLVEINPDLNGRINIINVGNWSNKDLVRLFNKGYKKEVSKELEEYVVSKCIHSPYIMQLLGQELVLNGQDITVEDIDKCAKVVASKFTHRLLLEQLPQMGSNATLYKADGPELEMVN